MITGSWSLTQMELSWQDDLGWTGSDIPNTIISTLDGGFVVGGYSGSSMGGDKSEGSYGSVDFWVLKFGADRLLDWDKTYGGGSSDYGPFALLEWPDQSIVIGGYSTSLPGGNKTAPYIGSSDYWVIRTDETGAIIWQQSLADLLLITCMTFVSTNDFGLLITGTSGSGLEGIRQWLRQVYRIYGWWNWKLLMFLPHIRYNN